MIKMIGEFILYFIFFYILFFITVIIPIENWVWKHDKELKHFEEEVEKFNKRIEEQSENDKYEKIEKSKNKFIFVKDFSLPSDEKR